MLKSPEKEYIDRLAKEVAKYGYAYELKVIE